MKFKLSDQVLFRIVQIIQEGIITGIDVTDLMRQIVLVQHAEDQNQLVLDEDYVKLAQRQLDDAVAEGIRLNNERKARN